MFTFFTAISVDIVSAALSRVAQLTEAIATALNIPLPHSIYTNHHSGNALIIPMYAEGGSALMLAPINWNVTRDSFRDFQWMSLDEVKEAQSRREKMQNNGMNMTKKEEDDSNVLRDDIHVNATFSQALRLLQADIVSLCVKMGLPAAGLWPPSALLLNLHALKEHVEQYVAGHTQEVQTEAASPPSSPPRLTKTTFYLGGGKANQKSNNNSHANLNLDSISAEDIVLNAASVRDMDSLLNARFYQHAVSHSVDSSLLQIVSDELQQDDVPSSSKEKIIPEVEDGWDVIDFDD